MLCLCRSVLVRFLFGSVLFPDRLERADLFDGLHFLRSARSSARSPEACRPVPLGFLFIVLLDLVRDHLKRADLFSSGFLVLVQLDLSRDCLTRADLF